MKNFVIIGTSCSGKTTTGKSISEKLSIKLIDLDQYNWLPGWKMRPNEELREIIKKEVKKPGWVVCGNYLRLQDITWPKADVIIWLDYPLRICLWRCLKRTIRGIITKEPTCNGNYETIRNTFFSTNSIFYWLFRSHFRIHRKHEVFKRLKQGDPIYKNITLMRFKSQKETDAWFKNLIAE